VANTMLFVPTISLLLKYRSTAELSYSGCYKSVYFNFFRICKACFFTKSPPRICNYDWL